MTHPNALEEGTGDRSPSASLVKLNFKFGIQCPSLPGLVVKRSSPRRSMNIEERHKKSFGIPRSIRDQVVRAFRFTVQHISFFHETTVYVLRFAVK